MLFLQEAAVCRSFSAGETVPAADAQDISPDFRLRLVMNSLLFYSGEIVKYAVIAEVYFLARRYFTCQPDRPVVCPKCTQRSLRRRGKGTSGKLIKDADELLPESKSPSPSPAIASAAIRRECRNEEVAIALFFPDTSLVTPSVKPTGGFNSITDNQYSTDYLMSHPTDGPFNQLLNILRSAKKSLDLCIYVLSFPPLCDVILDLYDKKSVAVRIIVDGREDEALRSQIPRLSRRGVDIRCNEKSYSILMHNKFAVIDSHILLTGSLNWTKSAVLLNHDNVLVTSNKSLVSQYSNQFEQLWSKFKPYGSV